jgi:POT family proton-dependent oligopeptide transporter
MTNMTLNAPVINNQNPASKREIFGHPAGLVTLFFTELWERFSYYGMRALLVLYMVAPLAAGGMQFDVRTAATIYGVYTMAVYMTSIPGGLVADRILGPRKAILLGGSIIALGHFSLAVPALPFFVAGLVLIVLGTGLLKPNISAMVGQLYPPGDNRRDAGFSIFYMGINIGAAVSPIVCGFFAQHPAFKAWLHSVGLPAEASWHFGFAAAGVGMLIGLAHLVWQRKLLDGIGDKPSAPPKVETLGCEGDVKTGAKAGLTSSEISRLGAVAILFVFNMLFWAVYEQGGSSLNLFADKLTRNEVFGLPFPSSWFQSVPAVFVILLAPVISEIWMKLGDRQPSSPAKFSMGLLLLGLGIALAVPATFLSAHGLVSPLWLCGVYFLQTAGELCLSPVGLSTVTKLAPARFVGMTMGVWFVSMSLGNALAGYLAGFFEANNVTALVTLFGGMGAVCALAALVLYLGRGYVKTLMSGVR